MEANSQELPYLLFPIYCIGKARGRQFLYIVVRDSGKKWLGHWYRGPRDLLDSEACISYAFRLANADARDQTQGDQNFIEEFLKTAKSSVQGK